MNVGGRVKNKPIDLRGHYIPHSGEQLHKPTIAKSERNDKVWRRDAPRLEVDQGQHKGGQGESAQAQRRRVGELAVLHALPETGLELTTERREARGLARVRVQERVAAIVVGADLVDAVGGGVGVDGVDGGLVLDRYGVGGGGGHGGGWFEVVG